MYGYIEPFYQAAPAAREPGHIWSDQPVYMPPRHGLKLTRVNPSDDRDLDFEIVGRTADTFNHAPVHSLRLESSEALVVTRAKWDRPVVILGGASASAVTPGSVHPTHLDNVWAVPIYGGDQYPEALRRRIQIYDFRNLFYLPADPALHFDEGFARLDHAQPIRAGDLRAHRGLMLSSDALDALTEWWVYFTTERIDPGSMILDYRREQVEPK